jgi:uncharacterized DUF497 family protein
MSQSVSFALAQAVRDDPLHVIVPDRVADFERRYHAIGMVGHVLLLVVVHMYPDAEDAERVQIIGARRAIRHERRRYEEDAA